MTMSDKPGLWTVRDDSGRTLDMVLCKCCLPDTRDYYRAIRWDFWRVRATTTAERGNHACLD